MWIKQVGCDCPECGPDPCTAGCACTFNANDQIFTDDNTYDWTSVNSVDHDISIAVTGYANCDTGFSACGFDLLHWFQIRVYADLTLLYDSGCIHANFSTTATVPAGTTTLRIVIDDPCGAHCGCESGGGGSWEVACI